jgi:hypothetical protein
LAGGKGVSLEGPSCPSWSNACHEASRRQTPQWIHSFDASATHVLPPLDAPRAATDSAGNLKTRAIHRLPRIWGGGSTLYMIACAGFRRLLLLLLASRVAGAAIVHPAPWTPAHPEGAALSQLPSCCRAERELLTDHNSPVKGLPKLGLWAYLSRVFPVGPLDSLTQPYALDPPLGGALPCDAVQPYRGESCTT